MLEEEISCLGNNEHTPKYAVERCLQNTSLPTLRTKVMMIFILNGNYKHMA